MFGAHLPYISNRATWLEPIQVIDDEDGTLIDLSGADEITVEVCRTGYSGSPVLSASLSAGTVVILDTGVFQFRFEASQVGILTNDAYDVGITYEEDGDTVQLLLGTVPILHGIVRA